MGRPGEKYSAGKSIGTVMSIDSQSVRYANADGFGGTKSSYEPGPLGSIRPATGRQDSPPDDPSPTRFFKDR